MHPPSLVGPVRHPGVRLPTGVRYNLMVPFELSTAIFNHITDSRLVLLNDCGHWPPFEKPAEWTAQVLTFVKGRERRVELD